MRDYQIFSSREGSHVSGGSAFNVKAESLRLGDFSEAEVRDLLAQHTAECGQAFEDGATERIWALTRGQPGLVNALAFEACFKGPASADRSAAISIETIDEAKEALILGRVTHLHQLAIKLREDRVRRVKERVQSAANAGELPRDWAQATYATFGMVLPDDLPINVNREINEDFIKLTQTYYDPVIRTKHTDVGGATHLGLGYGGCALPLVLEHNTPNNSVALLWAETEGGERDRGPALAMRPLFRRRQRHE